MTRSAPLDEVTTAVLGLLRGTGRPVFDSGYTRDPQLAGSDRRYAADPVKPPYPYGILYRIPGGSADATPDLGISMRDVTVAFQVTAVSNYRNQCEFTGRQFRDRIFDRELGGWKYSIAMPDGWFCTARLIDPVLPGVDQAGQQPTVTYSQPSRFYLTVARA